jgi:type IV pilus assembly protein PilY1
MAVFVLASPASASPLSIANDPLFLVNTVSPNIVLTLDDSGSMASAYAPDSISGDWGYKRFKSSAFNPLAYDPNVAYTPPVDANGSSLSTSYTQAWINGFDHSEGSFDLSAHYGAPYSYSPSSSCTYMLDPSGWNYDWACTNNTSSQPFRGAFYYKYDSSCGSANNDSCYTKVDVNNESASQQQNFANWFSFYRTRNLSVISASSLAFAQLGGNVRVAWQVLNACHGFSSSKDCSWNYDTFDNRIAKFQGTHRDNFYSWLARLPANGGTPLRAALKRVGDYYETSGIHSPYAYNPQHQDSPEYSCRPNYAVVMTDGLWNGNYSGPPSGNQDKPSAALTLPDGVSYSGSDPYQDNNSNSLADIAFYYWSHDLRSNLANDLTPYYSTTSSQTLTDSSGGTATLTPYWNPRNDPATWQHMVTFTVGVGLSTVLSSTYGNPTWGGNTFAGSYPDLVTGKTSWPAVSSNSNANVADLWHAAIDSRGEFFAADNPQDIVNAFQTIIQRIEAREGSASAATSNVGTVNANSQVFQAKFNSKYWTGQLLATRISDGNAPSGDMCYGVAQGYICGTVWDAGCNLTGGSCAATGTSATAQNWDTGRVMLTYAGGQGEPFRWSDLDTTEKNALIDSGSTSDGQNRLKWLRGDRAEEQQNGGSYRDRVSVLGDIVHSDPTFVGAPDFSYPQSNNWVDKLGGSVPENSAGSGHYYGDFVSNHKTRLNVVYIGSDDGFLHGFAAGSYNSSGVYQSTDNTGKEVLAFMPSLLFKNAVKLTDPNYLQPGNHRFFVDGQQAQGDVYYGGAWHSILVGSLGAGGQGIYALDVTNPGSFSEANASSIVKWEFYSGGTYSGGSTYNGSHTYTGKDLGYTFGRPSIVRLHDGKWGVLVPNGYNNTANDGNASSSGDAVMYVLDVSNGKVLAKLDTGVGTTATQCASKPNGLAYVTPVDLDGDGITDYVYAGDLCGDVWRFDLTGTSASQWHVSTFGTGTPTPLFRATGPGGSPQPITSKIIASSHPKGLSYGVELYFGTGKYFETGDNVPDTTHVQSIYGVWDHNFTGAHSVSGTNPFSSLVTHGSPATTYNLTRSNLTQQTINYQGVDNTTGNTTQGSTVRVLSNNSIDWTSSMGFYLDLEKPTNNLSGTAPNQTIATPTTWTAQGELNKNNPLVVGRSIVFTTTIPSDNPCSSGGSGWVMALNLANGGQQSYSPFYNNISGNRISGLFMDGVLNSPAAVSTNDNSGAVMVYVTGTNNNGTPPPGNPGNPGNPGGSHAPVKMDTGLSTGRLGWRELR